MIEAISPDSIPSVEGLAVPTDFYWIKAAPAPLSGMPYPGRQTPWSTLSELGFTKVVCLCSARPIYSPYPLELVVAVELDDLEDGGLPEFPEKEAHTIADLAVQVCRWLEGGHGVIVHCAGGRGRTGTLLGSILVMNGWKANDAIDHLDQIHKLRGRSGWPESLWQSALLKEIEASNPESSGSG